MKLTSQSFADQQPIPGEFAFGIPHEREHVCPGGNHNPHLEWHDLPAGTQSLALICHDPDVPTRGDDVNKEGRTVPSGLPRRDFFHWVLIDLPPTPNHIQAGEFSNEVSAGGKPGPEAQRGARHGVNDFTAWFAGDSTMKGDYHGYDGPCPPWNDEIPHHYVFTLYALDIARLPLEGRFTGPEAREAIAGHVLGQATLTGVYSLNPQVKC
jgi:Raf kinase inhibitor-like YbhB/YbcL family protein